MQTFSKKEAIRYGWQKMKENFWFFTGLILIVNILFPFVFGFLYDFVQTYSNIASVVVNIIYVILNIILTIGVIKILLEIYNIGQSSYRNLISQYNLFFKFIVGNIVYVFIVFAGLALFIIPGIIWGIKFMFWPYLIIDKGLGPIEALKESSKITYGNKWNLFLFGILLALIQLLGLIALIVGLFATIPTTMMAFVFVYKKLTSTLQEDGAFVGVVQKYES